MFLRFFFINVIFGAEKNATIEFQIANTSKSSFSGELKIYVGKNCNTRVAKGKICDYRYCSVLKKVNYDIRYANLIIQL